MQNTQIISCCVKTSCISVFLLFDFKDFINRKNPVILNISDTKVKGMFICISTKLLSICYSSLHIHNIINHHKTKSDRESIICVHFMPIKMF